MNSRLNKYITHIYSKRICERIGCEDVVFKRKINLLRGAECIEIAKGTIFGKMLVLTAWKERGLQRFTPSIKIGKDCNFGDYLHLTAINRVEIGDNVLTGRWVTITDNSHGTTELKDLRIEPIKRQLYSRGPVIIEDDVWIGDKATILPGVTIGRGSVIGANSVISKDIPPFCIATGNPAKIIKNQKCQN